MSRRINSTGPDRSRERRYQMILSILASCLVSCESSGILQ